MDVNTLRPGSCDEGGGGAWLGDGHSKAKNGVIVREDRGKLVGIGEGGISIGDVRRMEDDRDGDRSKS